MKEIKNETRVACLYRVSTKRQAVENDIPLQKKACYEFINRMDGWKLECEYTELGVSGYHKSAKQRDVLQQARKDAMAKKFDVLLVFMFDRLGRREDETPFIVEWFVAQGIAVWSVAEGQQRFESRVDKLLNYIRFWQSGGESEKTSMRVKEKHKQMVEEGKFRGGNAAYGYRLEEADEKNDKGYPLKKLVIDEIESENVREMFRLAVEEGYGGRRIARHFNERGILTKAGNRWTAVSVMELLKNPLYMGRYVSGRRPSTRGKAQRVPNEQWIWSRELIPSLTIVSETIWKNAETIRQSRKVSHGSIPIQTRGVILLSGVAECGSCEKKLVSRHTVKSWTRKDGTSIKYKQYAYCCASRPTCAGQKTYSQKRIDDMVMEIIYRILKKLLAQDITEKINEHIEKNAMQNHYMEKKYRKAIKGRERLQQEITKTFSNESPFTAAQLAESMNHIENEIRMIRDKINETKKINEAKKIKKNNIMIDDWYNLFLQVPISMQKMLLSRIFKSIHISRGYIRIQANIWT